MQVLLSCYIQAGQWSYRNVHASIGYLTGNAISPVCQKWVQVVCTLLWDPSRYDLKRAGAHKAFCCSPLDSAEGKKLSRPGIPRDTFFSSSSSSSSSFSARGNHGLSWESVCMHQWLYWLLSSRQSPTVAQPYICSIAPSHTHTHTHTVHTHCTHIAESMLTGCHFPHNKLMMQVFFRKFWRRGI